MTFADVKAELQGKAQPPEDPLAALDDGPEPEESSSSTDTDEGAETDDASTSGAATSEPTQETKAAEGTKPDDQAAKPADDKSVPASDS